MRLLNVLSVNPLDLVKLAALIEITSCKSEIAIGLIDGRAPINRPRNISVKEGRARCRLANTTG